MAPLPQVAIDLFDVCGVCIRRAGPRAGSSPRREPGQRQRGAIALGHPLGAKGTRLVTTLLHKMERRNAHYGLTTLCTLHGMAAATIIARKS